MNNNSWESLLTTLKIMKMIAKEKEKEREEREKQECIRQAGWETAR